MARARSAKSRPTHSDFSSIFACVSASAEISARIRTISAADELLSAIPRPSTTGALAGTWRSEVGIEAPVSRWFDLAETEGLITALRTCVPPQPGQAVIQFARCFY